MKKFIQFTESNEQLKKATKLTDVDKKPKGYNFRNKDGWGYTNKDGKYFGTFRSERDAIIDAWQNMWNGK